MKHPDYQFSKLLLALGVCIQTATLWAAEPPGRALATNAFFAFDSGVGRGQWPPAEQARVLKELGYDGISYNFTADITNRLAAFRAQGLKIFSLYVYGYLDRPVHYEPGLTNAVHLLKGTDTIIWLPICQARGKHEADAVRLVREVADLAAESGLRVALYPHRSFYVATAEDALQLLQQVRRSNVGLTLNLCHELMAGNGDRLEAIVRACAPHLFLVSINGANRGDSPEQTIKVLGDGGFEMLGFLQALDRASYTGPIGLQCYNLKGDPQANLRRSMAAWRKLCAERTPLAARSSRSQ